MKCDRCNGKDERYLQNGTYGLPYCSIQRRYPSEGEREKCEWIDKKSITNGDKIRSMSDEELAEEMDKYIRCDSCKAKLKGIRCEKNSSCIENMKDWLKQEVSE